MRVKNSKDKNPKSKQIKEIKLKETNTNNSKLNKTTSIKSKSRNSIKKTTTERNRNKIKGKKSINTNKLNTPYMLNKINNFILYNINIVIYYNIMDVRMFLNDFRDCYDYDVNFISKYNFPPLPEVPTNNIKSKKVFNINSYSPATIETYKSYLSKLSNYNIDVHNLISIDVAMEYLSQKLEYGTVIGYLSAILWYSKANNINEDKYEDISKEIGKYYKYKKDKLLKNELSEKAQNKYVNWKIIVNVQNSLKLLYEKDTSNKKLHMYYIIISLYVLMPPRRVKDYVELHVDSTQEIIQDQVIPYGELNEFNDINNDIESHNNNYYVDKGNKGYFVFHLYKTMTTYSSQYLELNPELHLILKDYVNKNNIENRESLLKLKRSNFSRYLQKIFMAYISKPLTVNDLRHIYIIHMKDGRELRTGYEQLKLSKQMAHSVSTQQDYYKNVDQLCDTVIDEANKKIASLCVQKKKYSCPEDKRKAKLEQTRISNMRRKERLQNEKKLKENNENNIKK